MSLDEFESHELNREKLSQAKGKLLFTLVRLNQAAKRQLLLENHQAIKYNAAWLIGVSQSAPDQAFRLQTEYEF